MAFPPPAIPGIGTAGGVTFILEDRTGGDVKFIAENTQKFIQAAQKRPEFSSIFSSALWDVPQIYLNVNQDQAMIQGGKSSAIPSRRCRRSWAVTS